MKKRLHGEEPYLSCRAIRRLYEIVCVYVKCQIPISYLTKASSVSSISGMSLWGYRHLVTRVGGREAAVHSGVLNQCEPQSEVPKPLSSTQAARTACRAHPLPEGLACVLQT